MVDHSTRVVFAKLVLLRINRFHFPRDFKRDLWITTHLPNSSRHHSVWKINKSIHNNKATVILRI